MHLINVVGLEKSKRPGIVKQPLIAKEKEKENREENGQGEMLKGFQLYMAENKESFNGDQEAALTQWKGMDKDAKDKYKVARIANVGGEGVKRKREGEDEVEEKKLKISTGSSKQKLAGFAFGGN